MSVALCVLRKSFDKINIKNSIWLSTIWLAIAILLGIVIFFYAGIDIAMEYITAYVIELALSIDNVFVFALIFKYFDIEVQNQHKVLFIGVLSAIVLRILMITFGIYILHLFEWIFLPFGLLLIYSGYKIPLIEDGKSNFFNNNFIIKLTKKYFYSTDRQYNNIMILKQNNKLLITPLTLALIVIENADIIFALDSIPAVFIITKEPFIALISNVLAVLGLRSMYFIMANAIQRFKYLRQGIGYMLVYIGIKMVLGYFDVHFPNYMSILTMVLLISSSITISIIAPSSPLQLNENIEHNDISKIK